MLARELHTPHPKSSASAATPSRTTKLSRLGLASITAVCVIAAGQPAMADQFGPASASGSSTQAADTSPGARPTLSDRRMTADLASDLGHFNFLPWANVPSLPLSDPGPDPDQQGGFVHPGVVYTKKDIARWSTKSPEYKRLATSGAGNVTSRSSAHRPVVYGTKIDHGPGGRKDPNSEMNAGLKDQSGFAKVQAVLWATDRKPQRRKKVISYLREFRSVKAIAYDDSQQFRLVAGWGCTNLAQAAELVNYRDADFRRFLTKVCYPILDWTNGGNWHASFADSRLAIAAYAGDRALWRDAKAYFYERIAQSIYHSAYDHGRVKPLHKEDVDLKSRNGKPDVPDTLHTSKGTAHVGFTVGHWGGWGAYPQIDESLKAKFAGVPFPDGTNAERRRDLAHVNMALGAWAHAARTILAQGEKLRPHAYDRLHAAFGYHAGRVLAYAKTGRMPNPAPVEGDGGGARFQGYYAARALFRGDTPGTVRAMLKRPEVRNLSAVGANHIVAEAFADGS